MQTQRIHMLNLDTGMGVCGTVIDFPQELMTTIGHAVDCKTCIAVLNNVGKSGQLASNTDRITLRISGYEVTILVDKMHDVWSESEHMNSIILKIYGQLCHRYRETTSDNGGRK